MIEILTPVQVDRARRTGALVADILATLRGRSLVGTNLLELELMADCGLSATQALHATTGSAADLLRVGADRGRLAEGPRADLVVVEGDPADVAGLRERVWMVYKNGTAVHVADDPSVVGVVALAPWWSSAEPVRTLTGRSLVAAHGRRDRLTSFAQTQRFVERARAVATDAELVDMGPRGHYLIAGANEWNDVALESSLRMLDADRP